MASTKSKFLDELKPGTLEYAQKYHEEMTTRKPNETSEETARRHYYAGVDDDGMESD